MWFLTEKMCKWALLQQPVEVSIYLAKLTIDNSCFISLFLVKVLLLNFYSLVFKFCSLVFQF